MRWGFVFDVQMVRYGAVRLGDGRIAFCLRCGAVRCSFVHKTKKRTVRRAMHIREKKINAPNRTALQDKKQKTTPPACKVLKRENLTQQKQHISQKKKESRRIRNPQK